MDALQFDRLAKALSIHHSRRGALRKLAALPLGFSLSTALTNDAAWASRRANGKRDRRERRGQDAKPGSSPHRRHEAQPEVVGGQPVPQGTFSFMTFVEATGPDGLGFNCGGTVIAPRFILTAAHCTQFPTGPVLAPEAFWIGIGQVDESRFTSDNAFGVVRVTQHPGWQPNPDGSGNITDFSFDAAILELDRAVPAGLASSIVLIGAGDTRFDGTDQPVVVTGWGLTADRGQPSTRLLQAGLNLTSQAACDELHGPVFQPGTVLCAGAPGRSSCQGDSGGPIFVNTLIGHTTEFQKKGKKCKKRRGKKRCKPTYKKVEVPVFEQTQVGISSFSGDPCDTVPNGFARVSDPEINNFITSVIGG